LTNDELSIIIHPIVGSFANMLVKRTWIIEIPVVSKYNSVFLNAKKVKDIAFNKEKVLLRFTFIGSTAKKQEIRITKYKSIYQK